MRYTELRFFMILASLIFLLFPVVQARAERGPSDITGEAHSLDLSKFVVDQLSYQGYLVDAADSSAVNATLEMTFRLFDSETKGAEQWSETHAAVEVSEGLFQVLLGSLDAFPTALFDGSQLWLQTEIGTEVLVPRKPVVSVAYSQKAAKADHAATADFAADAQQAIHADTAGYVPGVSAWTVSGDDIYRQIGKVGIGTASPLTELDVAGSVNATTYYGDGSNLTGVSGTADTDWTVSGSDMYAGVAGNVGIGTSSPGYKLHIGDGILGLGNSYSTAFPDWGSGPADIKRFAFHDDFGGQDNPILGTMRQDDGGTFREIAFLSKAYGSTERAIAFRQGNSGTSGVETWFLGQSGQAYFGDYVGIGTTSPQAGLHVRGNGFPRSFIYLQSDSAADAGLQLHSGNTVMWHIFNSSTDDNGLRIYNSDGSKTVFFADQEDGNVGIGTTSPSTKLEVVASGDTAVYGIETGSGNYGYLGSSTHGVRGVSSGGSGVSGSSTTGNGVFGYSNSYRGVYCFSGSGTGVYAYSGGAYAGYFNGDVHITGTLTGGKTIIDHPLDPENKLLRHNSVESPENLVIYRGKVRLDENGETVVELPDYFVALTREEEASIHLTPVGRPFLTGAEWAEGYHSLIIYGQSGREVFWEVLADRDDPVIRQLRRPVEEEKGPDNKLCEKGKLLYPEAYGYPESRGQDHGDREEMRRWMEVGSGSGRVKQQEFEQ